jgi:O-antigen/teichoic acid export membrane protein
VPINKRLYEEMQAKREAEHYDAERERRWSMVFSGLQCLMWAALGLICFAFAFHTTDPGYAEIYKWGAYVITYGGVTFTLARAYQKGERRGDW